MSKTCPVYEKCGGCRYLHLSYDEQLSIKENDLMNLYGKKKVKPIIGMKNPYHYRHKVYTSFTQDKKGSVKAGLFEEESHHVIPTNNCLIQDEHANHIIQTIVDWANAYHIQAYDEDNRKGILRHVYIRTSHYFKEVLVTIVIGSKELPKAKVLISTLTKTYPEIKTIILNYNHHSTSQVLSNKERVLYGNGTIQDQLLGYTFLIGSQSFYQVNPIQTEILYQIAIEHAQIKKDDIVLDACCGLGTISICASKHAKHVVGVEYSKQAIALAKQNARQNHIKNVSFYAMDIEEFLKGVNEHFDVVILDPPRSGLSRESIRQLERLKPSRIVYISCYPETQKRDCEQLKNYTIQSVTPVDLFPWSKHVETIVKLSQKHIDHSIRVELDLDEIDKIK